MEDANCDLYKINYMQHVLFDGGNNITVIRSNNSPSIAMTNQYRMMTKNDITPPLERGGIINVIITSRSGTRTIFVIKEDTSCQININITRFSNVKNSR